MALFNEKSKAIEAANIKSAFENEKHRCRFHKKKCSCCRYNDTTQIGGVQTSIPKYSD